MPRDTAPSSSAVCPPRSARTRSSWFAPEHFHSVFHASLVAVAAAAPIAAQSDPDSQGAKKTLVVLVDTRDLVEGQPPEAPIDPAGVLTLMQESSAWFTDVSGGRNSLDITSGDIFGWYQFPGEDTSVARRLAEDQAMNSGMDPSIYDRYVLAYAESGLGTYAIDQLIHVSFGTGSIGPFTMGYVHMGRINPFSGPTVIHELGHTMTLGHASFMSSLSGAKTEYGNAIDVMGGGRGVFSVGHLDHLGWVAGGDLLDVTNSGVYSLGPMELEGQGVRALRIARTNPNGFGGHFMLEHRQAIGRDSDLPDSNGVGNALNSVLPYVSQINSGKSRHRALDATPETRTSTSRDFGIQVGRSLVDHHTGICVTGLAQDHLTRSFDVEINFLAEFPDNDSPSVSDVTVTSNANGLSGGYNVTLSAIASDPDPNDTLSYFWNLGVDIYDYRAAGSLTGDGDSASGQQVSFTATGDPMTVRLQVSDRRGGLSEWFELRLFDPILRVPADFPTIQAAIDAATNGDEILVADGTYTGVGNRDIDTLGKRLRLRSENGPEVTIIDAQGAGRGFHIHSGEDSSTLIEGFTIRGGSSPIGAGALIQDAFATIQNCIIRDNNAFSKGGGLYLEQATGMRLINCVIADNSAGGFIPGQGGGIYVEDDNPTQSLFVINNTIVDNSTNGGVGPGVFLDQAGCFFANTILWDNGSAGDLQVETSSGGLAPKYNHCCSPEVNPTSNNVSTNPLLSANFRLSPYSPCIDRGGLASSLVDMVGQCRIDSPDHDNYEHFGTVNTSVGDIGAIEFVPTPPNGGGNGGGKLPVEQQGG